MSDSAVLWYLNRATGTVLLVLFTLVVVIGVLATFGRAGRGLPRFLTQAFHRQLSLLAVALLAAHVATAVLDTFVDIRWWQAVVPVVGSTYRPVWLGLGAVTLDLVAVIVVTSLLRVRLGHRAWRYVHLLSYLAWASAVVHGLGIGTDAGASWSRTVTLGCVGAVAVAGIARVTALALPRRAEGATR